MTKPFDNNPSDSLSSARPNRYLWILIGVALVSVGVFAVLFWPTADREPVPVLNSKAPPLAEMSRPIVKLTGDYVGSDACRKCHVHNHATWHASYHRTMTQVPNATNVVADFEDVSLQTGNATFKLSRDDENYWVEMDDPEWMFAGQSPRRIKRKIVLLTGSHHEQDFWFETPLGRTVQRLPFVFRIAEQEWYPDVSVLMTPPEAPSGFGNWNMVCIQCHTTLGRPRVDPNTGFSSTEVVEFGISCEACHGPGAGHIERHTLGNKGATVTAEIVARDQVVNPEKLDHRLSSQTCGQCHSITVLSESDSVHWMGHGFRFRPGQELTDSRIVVQPDDVDTVPDLQELIHHEPTFMDSRFWSDGMVRVTGREYNGMIKSPCYLRGEMSCLSCHDLHPAADDQRPLKEWANDQLKPGMYGNKACLQCHESVDDDLVAHTHHTADSEGSRCINCHMPPTTYGLLKAVHSHQIDSPNVRPSVESGRPNACNMCHLDKSLGWTNQHLANWHDIEPTKLTETQDKAAASILWAMKGDAGQRALAAWAMGWKPAQTASGTDWQGRILAKLLDDPYDTVRFVAQRSLQTLSGFQNLQFNFVSEAEERQRASQSALQRWEAQRSEAGKSIDLSELLNTESPDPDGNMLDFLLQQRDDRPIELAE